MRIGLSQIDITPKPGTFLSGFAARTQPSIGVLDALFVKALYLTEGNQKLLWIHCDLLELNREIVVHFRRWAKANLGLGDNEVTISVTHTHSGPRTAGTYDISYVALLNRYLEEAARKAMAVTEECDVVCVEGACDLAVDRRRTATAHTDPRVSAVGFRRKNGAYIAVLVNYAIHPVALGANNRFISADISGQIAKAVQQQVHGTPLVLVANGASGNLNPPAENVSFEQVAKWGRAVADIVGPLLVKASAAAETGLAVESRVITLPLDVLSLGEIRAVAEKALQLSKPIEEWGDIYRRAVQEWQNAMITAVQADHASDSTDAELFVIRIGPVVFVSINAEAFSKFVDLLREAAPLRVCVVGYANGGFGYLPTLAAYSEGGYEVDVAHIFQGHFRVKPGGLEFLAREAVGMVKDLAQAARSKPQKVEAMIP